MAAWFGKAGSLISSDGTDICVFLLDGTKITVRVDKLTTAGGVCLAIRDKLGLEADREYGLYAFVTRDGEEAGRLSHVRDTEVIGNVVKGWEPQDLCGSMSRRLYFKRHVYVIESVVDEREDNPEDADDVFHNLAFAEGLYNFLECTYRFPQPNAAEMSALLLRIERGPFEADRDTPEAIAGIVEDVLPRYLLRDRTESRHVPAQTSLTQAVEEGMDKDEALQMAAGGASRGRRWANNLAYQRVGCVDAGVDDTDPDKVEAAAMAMSRADAAVVVREEYEKLGSIDAFEAKKAFVQKIKEFVAFGADIYVGKRTWRGNDTDTTEDEVMERTEDVTICVAYSGIVFTGLAHPLGCEEHKYDTVTKWTLSEDSRVFAFQVEEPEPASQGLFKFVVYIVTDQAPDIEQSVDRFVSSLVEHTQDKYGPSRSTSDKGIGPVPTIKGVTDPPKPEYARVEASAKDSSSAASTAASEGDDADGTPASPSAASEASALPDGWEKLYDEEGDAYYYNNATEETQWERPTADDGEEEQGEQEATASEGERDGELPPGWEAKQDSDGDTFYFNSATGETQWEHPGSGAQSPTAASVPEEDLPEGWEKLYDEEGDAYYYNSTTDETQWQPPT